MKVVLTGGGTGGHITPLLAVAEELKKQNSAAHITYVGERHGKFTHLTDNHAAIDAVRTVYSGKFRRYHGDPLWKRLIDVRTNLLNARDVCFLFIGLIQSLFILRRIKPDVVFLKGGYVGVPVGLVCALYGIPFMTHDSDSVPGLANRLVARWASIHAVAGNPSLYPYPAEKVRQVGVIVSSDYGPVSADQQRHWKEKLGLPATAPVLLVTGGSLGARRINDAVKSQLDRLFEIPDLHIIHQVGKGNADLYDGVTHERLLIYEFLTPMHEFTGVADVVVTRAGANTLAELGAQGRACIVVPNEQLTDGHQTKNAQILDDAGSAVVIAESELQQRLTAVVTELLGSAQKRSQLGRKLQNQTRTDAAVMLAALLLKKV